MKRLLKLWIRRTILIYGFFAMVIILAISLVIFISIAATQIVSGQTSFADMKRETTGDVDGDIPFEEVSVAWQDEISWTHPISGAIITGLTDELKEQLEELNIEFPTAILWVLVEITKQCDHYCALELAKILSPRDLVIVEDEIVTETTTVTTTITIDDTDEDNPTEETTITSEVTTQREPVLLASKINMYNGQHIIHYTYETTEDSSTETTEIDDNTTETVETIVKITRPIIYFIEHELDYTILYAAMKEANMKENEADLRVVLVQAQLYNPLFVDFGQCSSVGEDFSPNSNALIEWPVPGVYHISSCFGIRIDPFTGEQKQHNGIDIPAPVGTAVVAANDGTIDIAAYGREVGNMIRIVHDNGDVTRYFHLSSYYVSPGDRVRRGDLIGAVGSTGRSTGPHLHFEYFRSGSTQQMDPISLFLD